MTATLLSSAGSSGNAPLGLAASTNERAAICRARLWPSMAAGLLAGGTDSGTPASAPTRAASRSTRRTCSSITSTGTVPSRTAATSLAPHGLPAAGIARSRPPLAAATVSLAASQSDTMKPSKPHSPLSTPSCSGPLFVIDTPLTRLYADITPHAPAARTIVSNGARYSSRSARSLTCALAVNRSVSKSLATKCLIVVATPWSCTPVT